MLSSGPTNAARHRGPRYNRPSGVGVDRGSLRLVTWVAACSCTDETPAGDDGQGDGPPLDVDYVGPYDVDISFYPHAPPILDFKTGEYTLGQGGSVIVGW